MSQQKSFDTDCMTLTRFVLTEQKKYPNAQGFLSQLLTSIQSAVKVIPVLEQAIRFMKSIFTLISRQNLFRV
jgi:fructose-1,6-bisphosphatase